MCNIDSLCTPYIFYICTYIINSDYKNGVSNFQIFTVKPFLMFSTYRTTMHTKNTWNTIREKNEYRTWNVTLHLCEKFSARIRLQIFSDLSLYVLCAIHNNVNSRKGENKIGFMTYCAHSVNMTTSSNGYKWMVYYVLVFIEYRA